MLYFCCKNRYDTCIELKRNYIMKVEQFNKYLKALEEESRECNLEGEVSYPYVAGVLGSVLRTMLCESATMKEAVEQLVLDRIEEQ